MPWPSPVRLRGAASEPNHRAPCPPYAAQTVGQAIGHRGRMRPDQRTLPGIPQQGALPLQRRGHSRIRAPEASATGREAAGICGLVRAGPARHRKPLSTPGASGHDQCARTAGHTASPPRPGTTKQHEAGFGSHLTAAAGQRPLPARQASPRTGLTLPPRWCHRRQARAMFILTGRAPDVPYASVGSGHSRTTRVGACSLRAVGSLHTERSQGASQARGGAQLQGRDSAIILPNSSAPSRTTPNHPARPIPLDTS
jgi:hypothetical protein